MSYTIQKEPRRHFITENGEDIAEITFSPANGAVIADSTWVDDAHRGQGLGEALLDSLVADARAEGFRIVPLCPFVKSRFDRDHGYDDVNAMA